MIKEILTDAQFQELTLRVNEKFEKYFANNTAGHYGFEWCLAGPKQSTSTFKYSIMVEAYKDFPEDVRTYAEKTATEITTRKASE